MASGIEVAGLVLAIIPLVVKAAASCHESTKSGWKLFGRGHRKLKSNLLEDLNFELCLFHRHLKLLIRDLPDLSEERCEEVLGNLAAKDWKAGSDVVRALNSYLGAEDFQLFEHGIDRVYTWIDRLVKDDVFRSHFGSQVNGAFFLRNLKFFSDPTRVARIDSALKDRLQLWWQEQNLREEIKEIGRWRIFVEKITEKQQNRQALATATSKDTTSSRTRPSCLLQRLSQGVYHALSQKWKCGENCPATHSVKLCLHTTDELHRGADPESIDFKLLLSLPHERATPEGRWRESRVTVKSLPKRTNVSFQSNKVSAQLVTNVCSVIREHRRKERPHASLQSQAKLSLSAEYFENDSTADLYRTRSFLDSNFSFDTTSRTITLADALTSLSQVELKQKRQLALSLAYGLMTVGSPWMGSRWSKAEISFFYNADKKVCILEPFISSDMGRVNTNQQPLSLDVIHPVPSILSLGIVLLELETGEAIEAMRKDDDYVDPGTLSVDENTDFTAAVRAAESLSMSSPKHKQAILACLDEKIWGDDASMAQAQVRRIVYDEIIERLEADLEDLQADAQGTSSTN